MNPENPTTEPLFQTIADGIKEKYLDGSLKSGDKLPPDRELYKSFGANKHTVIRALSELQKEGLIVRKRGSGTFVADPQQKPLIPGRTLNIGLLTYLPTSIDFNKSDFGNNIVRGILQEWGIDTSNPTTTLDKDAVRHQVWNIPHAGINIDYFGESDTREVHVRRPPESSFINRHFDGFICIGIIEEKFIEFLLRFNIPMVLVDYPMHVFENETDQVFVDPYSAVRDFVSKMQKKKCKKIHFAGALQRVPQGKSGDKKSKWTMDNADRRIEPDSLLRLNALRQAMEMQGLSLPDESIHFTTFDKSDVDNLVNKLSTLPQDKQPDAILCHGINWAESIKAKFAEKNLSIEVIGATHENKTSKAHQLFIDGKELGRVAADLLHARLERPERAHLNVGIRMEFKSAKR